MEHYKEKLKLENAVLIISILILAAFSALGFLAEMGILPIAPVTGDSHWQSQWRGFVSGAAIGVLALMAYCLVRNLMALKDDAKLKKLYIKTHDERTNQVYTQARSAAMSTFLILGLVAIIAAGYFSITVSITLLVCVLSGSLLCVLYKVYYNMMF